MQFTPNGKSLQLDITSRNEDLVGRLSFFYQVTNSESNLQKETDAWDTIVDKLRYND